MTHNCRKPEKYLFPGNSGCIFDPARGVPVNPHFKRVQYMYGKGGQGVKNAWLWAPFNQSPAIGKGLIKSRP